VTPTTLRNLPAHDLDDLAVSWAREEAAEFETALREQRVLRAAVVADAASPGPPGLDKNPAASILNHVVQYSRRVDRAFAALSDPTRRGILECLGRGDASISDLAERFGMTLTGVRKHVRILEGAGLVTTRKVGRVRSCRLGPRRLEDEVAWIEAYRRMLDARLTRLEALLERTKGAP